MDDQTIQASDLGKHLSEDRRRQLPELRKKFLTLSHEDLAARAAAYYVLLNWMAKTSSENAELRKKIEDRQKAHQNEMMGYQERYYVASQEIISLLKAELEAVPRRAAKRATNARWSRLERAKQLAFERRKQFAHLKRSPAIDKFLPEILEACRAAGEPLTGGDPKATVERWFRKAGIK